MVSLSQKRAKKQTPEEIAKDQETAKRFAELSERTRLLEERLKQTHQKMQVIDETSMKKINELKSKIKSLSEQASSFRKEYEESKNILRRIVKDLGQSAKLSDVRVLEKYINMVDITRLVTKEDVIRYIEEYMEAHAKKKKKKKG